MNDESLRDPITGELPRRRHPPWFWIAFWSLVLAVLLTLVLRLARTVRHATAGAVPRSEHGGPGGPVRPGGVDEPGR